MYIRIIKDWSLLIINGTSHFQVCYISIMALCIVSLLLWIHSLNTVLKIGPVQTKTSQTIQLDRVGVKSTTNLDKWTNLYQFGTKSVRSGLDWLVLSRTSQVIKP